MDLPHLLDKGIYLEDSEILLDWNSSREVLLQLSQPQTEELPGNRQGILWSNRCWLGGLTATFYAALKKNEYLRSIEIWPLPGKDMANEFQRFLRHLSLHLGAATRSSDRPGQFSRFWKRGKVELSLKLNSRSDRLNFVISYHGPKPFMATEQNAGDRSFDRQLERLGLTMDRWHVLKNYLLDLQAGSCPAPPAELLDHPITQLALRYQQTHDRTHLDQAAAELTGTASQAWLVLEKS